MFTQLPADNVMVCYVFCRADLDPIYYCELLKACEVKDDGDATIQSLTVNPTSVPKGMCV